MQSIVNPLNAAEPWTESRHDPTVHAFDELEMNKLLYIKPVLLHGQQKRYKIMDFFVTDTPTIHHRMDVFEDLMANPAVGQLFAEILPNLSDMVDLVREKENDEGGFFQHFYYVRRLELYVSTVDKIHQVLASTNLCSQGLKTFAQDMAAEYHSEAFQNLKANLHEYLQSVKHVKSVTVGINLDNQLRLDDLGILSINEEYFTGGSMMETLLSADFSSNPSRRFMTHFTPVIKGLPDEQALQVTRAFNAAINTVVKRAAGTIRADVAAYLKVCTDKLYGLIPEISFLLAGLDFLTTAKAAGVPLCKPKYANDGRGAVTGLVNLHLLHSQPAAAIVPNDVVFDENGMIYILTGANSGGKTVFLNALGAAQILYQLGLPIPAREAVMAPVENIHVHFPIKETIQSSAGRLEYECALLSKMLKSVTPNSLVLMDETFSSTSAKDGLVLAEEVLKKLSHIGCRAVFSTHIHELAEGVGALNSDGQAKIDNLTVATDGSGRRMYKVLRQSPDGSSHAKDIAKKYGLLLDQE